MMGQTSFHRYFAQGGQTTLTDFTSAGLTPTNGRCRVCGDTIDDAARHYLNNHPDAVSARMGALQAESDPSLFERIEDESTDRLLPDRSEDDGVEAHTDTDDTEQEPEPESTAEVNLPEPAPDDVDDTDTEEDEEEPDERLVSGKGTTGDRAQLEEPAAKYHCSNCKRAVSKPYVRVFNPERHATTVDGCAYCRSRSERY